MTQKDIADLLKTDVDFQRGRITRKRSKTASFENVPTVSYLLWPETLRLLQKLGDKGCGKLLLLNENSGPLLAERYEDNGKFQRTDNIKSAFTRLRKRLDINKPLKSLKKSSASRLRNNERFNGIEDLFLGHAPRRMSDKHYTTSPEQLLDAGINWLAEEFGLTPRQTRLCGQSIMAFSGLICEASARHWKFSWLMIPGRETDEATARIKRRAMGGDQRSTPGKEVRSGTDGQKQPLVRQRGLIHRPHRHPLATYQCGSATGTAFGNGSTAGVQMVSGSG